jgi:hypothetical protein
MQSVPLTLTQKFTYYLLPMMMIGFGIIPLYFWMTGKTDLLFTLTMAILLASSFFIVAIILYLRQKRSLNYYSIPSDLNTGEKNKIVREILRDHNWAYKINKHNLVQAEGNGFRSNLDLRSWSELLTIEISNNDIKVNSICNPDGWIAQAFSFGKNRQNTRDFEMIFLQRLNQK